MKTVMAQTTNTSETIQDTIFAGGLISSPAWVPWITNLNAVLTTCTLVLGIALAAVRIRQLLKQASNPRPGSADNKPVD